jgi:hypothetical protein
MQATVHLERINGIRDRSPRQLEGMIGVTVRERSGRTVRVMSLVDKTLERPTLAELWEPTVLSWSYHMLQFQGYEDNDGRWSVQTWKCELQRA